MNCVIVFCNDIVIYFVVFHASSFMNIISRKRLVAILNVVMLELDSLSINRCLVEYFSHV